MHVWIDQDLCTGDGLCTDHCHEVFVLLEDGISYVRDSSGIGNDPGGRSSSVLVRPRLEQHVITAALDCPGECIFIEVDDAATSAAADTICRAPTDSYPPRERSAAPPEP